MAEYYLVGYRQAFLPREFSLLYKVLLLAVPFFEERETVGKYLFPVLFLVSVYEWHEVTVKMALNCSRFTGFVNKRDTITVETVSLFLIHYTLFDTSNAQNANDGATAQNNS